VDNVNRKHVIGALAALAALAGGAGIAAADPDGTNPQSAEITRDAGCLLFDGLGNLVFADGSHSVVTSSGRSTLTCEASGVTPPPNGAAVQKGFLCNTFLGLTTDTHSVVTPSGNSKLVCRV